MIVAFNVQALNYETYCRSRICSPSFRRLHEFVHFAPDFRKLTDAKPASVSVVNDFVAHLVAVGVTVDVLTGVAQIFEHEGKFDEEVTSKFKLVECIDS